MTIEYRKRLLDLREYATEIISTGSIDEPEIETKSIMSKPKDKNKEEEKEYSIDEIQKEAFLQVVLSNLDIKDGIDDSVGFTSARTIFNKHTQRCSI